MSEKKTLVKPNTKVSHEFGLNLNMLNLRP